MTRRVLRLTLAAVLALAACSKPHAPPASTGRAVAVAKGVVEAQGGLVQVRAPRDGAIAALLVEEGDAVGANQPLARLDDRQARLVLAASAAELGDRQAQLEVASARAAGAEREAGRLHGLAAADAATAQDAEQAATAAAVGRGERRQAEAAVRAAEARQRLDAYEVDVRTVRAPAAGRIIRRAVAAGAYVAGAAPLFTLEPNGARIVRAELDEAFAGQVRPGMTAVVSPEFGAGRGWRATVTRLSDVLAETALPEEATARADTRVITVTLALPEGCDLRLGQRVLVRFGP